MYIVLQNRRYGRKLLFILYGAKGKGKTGKRKNPVCLKLLEKLK
jgi:hypothetical protein